ncbi:hypothetical protein SO802_015979 [Lithocarpus litseifolius]|uniref:PGG domain-containing protein n=1 Tax=Lithocarpus litseifolius TaxID=425828 RepID=A0AAW2CXM6_9ROSI
MISEDKRNALLVVTTLLIALTYEGLLNPPGGIWQEDSSIHGIQKSLAMKPNLSFNKNATLPEKIAGTPIGLRLLPFWLFLASNSVTFMFSYITILLLIPFEKGERIERLKQVAQCGDVDTLYVLIQEDAYLLDHIDRVPFFDTPLHIAVCNGHVPFVMEMVRLKPSFVWKPNLEGFSPIHLALQYKHTEMVSRFQQVNGDLVRIKGREGITPLHYAVAVDDQLVLLAEFLLVCLNSIEDVTT